jgi:CBS domain containing-hemolysin-like protein
MIIPLKIAFLVVLALASLSLAAVEAAFYLVKRRRLSHLSLHNPRAETVNRYLDDPPSLLMPVHMGTYSAHVAMTLGIASLFMDLIDRWALVVAFVAMVIYLLLFRLSIPYALVRRNPERSLLVLLPFFDLYARALRPLVDALRNRAAHQESSLHDTEGRAQPAAPDVPPPPVHDQDEGRLMDAVARFSVTLVRDVMTPRPDVVAIGADQPVESLKRLFAETKYSRIMVHGENLDDVEGVVTVHDVMDHEGEDSDPLRPLVRPAHVVPETKKIADLLKEFQAKRLTFAVVVDEYGGTAGVVTVEDIVEELVGEIKDEYDLEGEPIAVEPDGAVVVAGRVNVERLEQALETRLANGEEVDTVGGLVTAVFGRIPRTGERMEYRGFEMEVTDAERTRVNWVRIRRLVTDGQ